MCKHSSEERKRRDCLEDHNLGNSLLKEGKHIIENLSGILNEIWENSINEAIEERVSRNKVIGQAKKEDRWTKEGRNTEKRKRYPMV